MTRGFSRAGTAESTNRKSMDMDYFEHSWQLLNLFWIVPLFTVLALYAAARRRAVLRKIFGNNADPKEQTTLSTGKRLARLWLLLAAVVLLCVAAARPRWDWRLLPFSGRGRDVMIVLDVSKSMLSEDIAPTRLKHAKMFIRNLVNKTPGDRYGLVLFAGSPFLECPLTMDKTSLFQTLDEASPDSIPLGGTNIERAVDTALAAFKAAESGYRAIVLVTDGDELSGDCDKTVAELKRKKIPLFIVGIGNPSGDGLIKMTGPDGKTTLLRDSMGRLVKSRLNESKLRELAKAIPGGVYVRSTETDLGLAPILAKIHALIPKEYSKGMSKRPIEKFHYPLFLAVVLLLIRMGIGERRSKRKLAAAASIAIMATIAPLSDANAAGGNAPPSPTSLELAKPIKTKEEPPPENAEKKPPTAEELYNKGLECHRKHDTDKAVEYYRKAINVSKTSPEARSKAFQNLGVIAHQKGRDVMKGKPEEALTIFKKAEKMYRESMRSDIKRKHVVLNQQKLLDDRELAKQIKKRQDELRKKQQQARKKTQQALDKQKKENKKRNDKKQQQQQQKQQQQKQQQQKQQKQQQQKQQQQKQQQRQNKNQNEKNQKQQKSKADQAKQKGSNDKEQRKQQGAGEKRDENKKERQPQQQNKGGKKGEERDKETEKKIDEAEKSVDDYSKEARRQKNRQAEANAEAAKREIKKAQQEHQRGNGGKSEEHLKNALNRLGGNDKEKKKGQDKKQDGKNQKGKKQDGKKNNEDKQKKEGKQKGDDNQPIPKQPKQGKENGRQGEDKQEKEIDPAQAEALLDLMANQEKTLRDAIKECQKRNAKVKKVIKDW